MSALERIAAILAAKHAGYIDEPTLLRVVTSLAEASGQIMDETARQISTANGVSSEGPPEAKALTITDGDKALDKILKIARDKS